MENQEAPGVKWFHPHGPHEEVTDRLRNILRDYPDAQIFHELLQNADDAGATEMKVMVDWREAPESPDGLLQADMRPWQGPALWVYNNRCFSDQDFDNIIKLGAGTKENDVNTAGKFGLGFNSVYHLTDVPSFLSGSRYVIFDPYKKYVSNHLEEEPGMITDLKAKPKCLKTYANHFQPYHNVFDCNTESRPEFYYDGTLFRLPLRTAELAKSVAQCFEKPISQKHYNESNILRLINNFKEESEKILLFTRHVTKVSFHWLASGDSPKTVVELFSVAKQIQQPDNFQLKTVEVSVELSALGSEVLDSKERFNHTMVWKWLIVSHQGQETVEGQQQGLVPCVEVAVLHPAGAEHSPIKGELFAYLPLSQKTGLPIHINGSFRGTANNSKDFLKSSSSSSGNFSDKWNKALLELVAPAYAKLLSECQNILQQMSNESCRVCLEYFHSLFPNVQTSDADWTPLCKSVYQTLVDKEYAILPVLRQESVEWYPAGCEYSGDCAVFVNKENQVSDGLQKTLINIGCKLTCSTLFPHFEKSVAGVTNCTVTPKNIFEFVKSQTCTLSACVGKSVSDTPLQNTKTLKELMQYISRGTKDRVSAILSSGAPLLLTQDGVLRSCDPQNPVFCSPYSDLVSTHKSQFVHADFVMTFMPSLSQGKSQLCVKPFTVEQLATMLAGSEGEVRSKAWLKMFWTFVQPKKKKSFKEFLSKFKRLFTNQRVLPVMSSGNVCKLSEAKEFFFFPYKNRSNEICRILSSLGHKELDVSITSGKIPTNGKDPQDVAQNCVRALESPHNVITLFSIIESGLGRFAIDILNYINMYKSEFQYDHGLDASRIKSLPIFQTISGKVVSIRDNERPYYLQQVEHGHPSEVYSCFRSLFLSKMPRRVLLENSMDSLYSKLGFQRLSFEEFVGMYIRSVVSTLSSTPQDQIMDQFEYIKDILIPWLEHTRQNHMVDGLYQELSGLKLKCIPVEGTFMALSKFHNPKVDIFRVMACYKGIRLLPEEFSTDNWLPFLVRLGLKTTVTEDFLLKCATTLSIQRNVDVDLEEKTKLVVQNAHSIALERNSGQTEFLATLSKVRFIPCKRVEVSLVEICSCDQSCRAVSLEEGVSSTHEDLVWAVASLLPDWADPVLQTLPDVSLVVKNCIKVCSTVNQKKANYEELSQSASKRLKEALGKMYDFLQNHVHVDSQSVKSLKEKAVIPVGDQFVCAHQVTGRIQKDIQPYLYGIPLEFGPYSRLFMTLGMSESPTLNQYCEVLKQIYSDTSLKKDLNPNEKENVSIVVRSIFQLLSAGPVPEDFPRLFLPDKLQHLYLAKEMFVSDNPRLEDRVKSLPEVHIIDLRGCGLVEDIVNLVNRLPETVRPRLLSSVCREDLVGGASSQCDLQEYCPLVKVYTKRMQSPDFTTGLCCIIKHACAANLYEQEILELLAPIRIVCMKELKTCLVRTDGNGTWQEVPSSSPAFSGIFDDGKPIVHLCHSEYPGSLSVVRCVVDCVRKVLSEAGFYIDTNRIRDGVLEDMLFFRSVLGHLIPEDLHDWLRCMDDGNCHVGDCVGYQDLEEDSDDVIVYYGRVVDIDRSEDGFVYKVSLGGKRVVECYSWSLHEFYRPELPLTEYGEVSPIATNQDLEDNDEFEQECEKIRDILDYAQNLPSEEEIKVVSDLRLKWDPDKHIGEESKEFATKVFQFLNEELDKMDKEREKHTQWRNKHSFSQKVQTETEMHDNNTEQASSSQTPSALPMTDAVTVERLENSRSYLRRAEKDFNIAKEMLHRQIEWVFPMCENVIDNALQAGIMLYETQTNETDVWQKANLLERLISRTSAVVPHIEQFFNHMVEDSKHKELSGDIVKEKGDGVLDAARKVLELVREHVQELQDTVTLEKENRKRQNPTDCPSQADDEVPSKRSRET